MRNSILQAIFGLRNVAEADEVGSLGGYDFLLQSFWQVVELKRSSYDQIMAVFTDTTQMDFSTGGTP